MDIFCTYFSTLTILEEINYLENFIVFFTKSL
jgi:hypothetical protein